MMTGASIEAPSAPLYICMRSRRSPSRRCGVRGDVVADGRRASQRYHAQKPSLPTRSSDHRPSGLSSEGTRVWPSIAFARSSACLGDVSLSRWATDAGSERMDDVATAQLLVARIIAQLGAAESVAATVIVAVREPRGALSRTDAGRARFWPHLGLLCSQSPSVCSRCRRTQATL